LLNHFRFLSMIGMPLSLPRHEPAGVEPCQSGK
jgi:hypothetical protein